MICLAGRGLTAPISSCCANELSGLFHRDNLPHSSRARKQSYGARRLFIPAGVGIKRNQKIFPPSFSVVPVAARELFPEEATAFIPA